MSCFTVVIRLLRLRALEVPCDLSALCSVLVPVRSATTELLMLCRCVSVLLSVLRCPVRLVCVRLSVPLLLLLLPLVLCLNDLYRECVRDNRARSALCRVAKLPVCALVSLEVVLLWVTSVPRPVTRKLCRRVSPCSLVRARCIEVSPPLLLVCLRTVPLSVTCTLPIALDRCCVRDLSLLVCPPSTLGLLLREAISRLSSDCLCLLVSEDNDPSCLRTRDTLR